MIQSPNQPRARDTQPLHAFCGEQGGITARKSDARYFRISSTRTHTRFVYHCATVASDDSNKYIIIMCVLFESTYSAMQVQCDVSLPSSSGLRIARFWFIYTSICFQTWEGWPNDMYTYIDTEHNNQIDWFVNYPDLGLNMMWWQDNIRVICRPLPNWEIVYECVMWDVMGWGSLVMWVPAIGSDEAYSYCFCASSYTTRYALINCQWWGLIGVMDAIMMVAVFKRWMIICNELIVFFLLHNILTEQ